MQFGLSVVVLSVARFAGMILLIETGRRVGVRRLAQDAEGARAAGSDFRDAGSPGSRVLGVGWIRDGWGTAPQLASSGGLAAAISIAAYIILALEFPRLGLIQVSEFDQALVELRDSMK